MTDPVNPPHYKKRTPEPIQVIESWGLGFNLGNALKYIARAGEKDPTKEVEDLRKAVWYLNRQIKCLEEAGGYKPVQGAPLAETYIESAIGPLKYDVHAGGWVGVAVPGDN